MTPSAFASLARALQGESVRLGLTPVAFRNHPRSGPRAIRRFPDQTVVLIALGDRDPNEVAGDMIDGIVAAQSEDLGDAESMIRGALWEAAGLAVTV
jgi:hypothetical protein